MEEVQYGNKKVGDPQVNQIGVLGQIPAVPGDHEKGAGDNDAEELRDAMKQEIMVEAGQVETNHHQKADHQGSGVAKGKNRQRIRHGGDLMIIGGVAVVKGGLIGERVNKHEI